MDCSSEEFEMRAGDLWKEPEGRRDDEADEGGRRSEQEEVDDLEGPTEEILQRFPVFGEGFVVTA